MTCPSVSVVEKIFRIHHETERGSQGSHWWALPSLVSTMRTVLLRRHGLNFNINPLTFLGGSSPPRNYCYLLGACLENNRFWSWNGLVLVQGQKLISLYAWTDSIWESPSPSITLNLNLLVLVWGVSAQYTYFCCCVIKLWKWFQFNQGDALFISSLISASLNDQEKGDAPDRQQNRTFLPLFSSLAKAYLLHDSMHNSWDTGDRTKWGKTPKSNKSIDTSRSSNTRDLIHLREYGKPVNCLWDWWFKCTTDSTGRIHQR